jgi:phage/conjugal plasmid C-4 type zinc finger TraR family protein
MSTLLDSFLEQQDANRMLYLDIRAAHRYQASARLCHCGTPIPEARRQALPGVSTCIDCQQEQEFLARHTVRKIHDDIITHAYRT